MKFGVELPQRDIGHSHKELLRYISAIEDEGFSFIQAVDHVLGVDLAAHPDKHFAHDYDVHVPLHEQFALFAYLAGTTNLDFATGILILPQRQTALVAKQAAELDILSEGRLRLGVGIGWNPVEYHALGTTFDDRGDRFEEQIHVLRRFWTEEAVTFEGRFHQIHAAGILPRPTRPIPIWIGGGAGPSKRVLDRIGRLADGWLASLIPADDLAVKLKFIHEVAREAGREEPPDVGLVVRCNNRDLDQLRREIDAAMAVGVTTFTIKPERANDPAATAQKPSTEWHFDHLHFVASILSEYQG